MATYNQIEKYWTISAGNNGTFRLYLSEIITNEYSLRYGVDNLPSDSDFDNLNTIINSIYEPCCINFKLNIKILPSYFNAELEALLSLNDSSKHLTGQALDIEITSLGRNVKNSDLFYFIKDNLEYDELIWEFGNELEPEYIHISYISDLNKNKTLRLRDKGLNYENFTPVPTLYQGFSN